MDAWGNKFRQGKKELASASCEMPESEDENVFYFNFKEHRDIPSMR